MAQAAPMDSPLSWTHRAAQLAGLRRQHSLVHQPSGAGHRRRAGRTLTPRRQHAGRLRNFNTSSHFRAAPRVCNRRTDSARLGQFAVQIWDFGDFSRGRCPENRGFLRGGRKKGSKKRLNCNYFSLVFLLISLVFLVKFLLFLLFRPDFLLILTNFLLLRAEFYKEGLWLLILIFSAHACSLLQSPPPFISGPSMNRLPDCSRRSPIPDA